MSHFHAYQQNWCDFAEIIQFLVLFKEAIRFK